MKKSFVVLSLAILLSVCAVAQDRELFRIAVPFPFTAENASFSPGTYTVYLLDPYNAIRVESRDGRQVAFLRALPAHKSVDNHRSELVFSRIDGEYFLTEVRESDNGIQRDLSLGNHARGLIAKNHSAQKASTTVALAVH